MSTTTAPAGPCNVCGESGPNGLFDTPGRLLVCAPCLDDVHGTSAQHGTRVPAR